MTTNNPMLGTARKCAPIFYCWDYKILNYTLGIGLDNLLSRI